MVRDEHEFTELLRSLGSGENGAVDELFAAVYDDLRRLARAWLCAVWLGERR